MQSGITSLERVRSSRLAWTHASLWGQDYRMETGFYRIVVPNLINPVEPSQSCPPQPSSLRNLNSELRSDAPDQLIETRAFVLVRCQSVHVAESVCDAIEEPANF